MTENNKHGKREASVRRTSLGSYWRQHKAWVAGLDRGQKIKYRLFQVLVVLAVVFGLAFFSWQTFL